MSYNYNLTGTAGEYFVCSELSQRDILPLLTPKNNPLFDIIATNQDGSRYVAIQVKTMGHGNKQGWKLNKQIQVYKNNPNLFLVLVNLTEGGNSDFYVYQYDKFVEKVNCTYQAYIDKPHHITGKPKKEVNFRWYNFADFAPDDFERKNDWAPIIENLAG
ncbi:aspartate-ammonia lyase [Zunongwangia sp. H14]|uniref:aspartate-ammonia lyase n=1 Tax=Zunongwangia sp. H14 TaxID=3240792 RepID=UPI003561D1DC